jgi:hypothetical protein
MATKSDYSWRDILLPEGMIEDLLKASFHLDEKQCRGFFGAAESLLEVEYPKYKSYLRAEAKVVQGRHGNLLVVK